MPRDFAPEAVLGLAHSFAEATMLDVDFYDAAEAALSRLGLAKDGKSMIALASSPYSTNDGQGKVATRAIDVSRPQSHPCLLHDDAQIAIIWKPPGWIVMPAGSAMEAEEGEDYTESEISQAYTLTSFVAELWGPMHPVCRDTSVQSGFVHRLDRNTSGAVCCAKSYLAYYQAVLQFSARRVLKEYVCLCAGAMSLEPHFIDAPLRSVQQSGAHRALVNPRGKRARTEVLQVTHLADVQQELYSLVQVQLHTGRMHQIRAHLSWQGQPLVGDPAYGGPKTNWCPRIFLHARRVRFVLKLSDPVSVDVTSPLPDDLCRALGNLVPLNAAARDATRVQEK